MDKSEHFGSPLSLIPMKALSLRLTRSVVKMRHGPGWSVDKMVPTYDMIIPLTGSGAYDLEGERLTLSPGHAMLIPPYTRFQGRRADRGETYTGIAQHFSLELFGKGEILSQMALKRVVRFDNWEALRPMVRHYHDVSPRDTTTLAQHHLFMVLLLAFLDHAFLGWEESKPGIEAQDQLSKHIMIVASRLSADPLGAGLEEVIANVPYNPDYFRRAFRDRIGMTPQKFREHKRMEFAIGRLSQGRSVKVVAAELGYSDPYFFSRMFKRYLGASPSSYRERRAARRSPAEAEASV